jgi:hypothetical protein
MATTVSQPGFFTLQAFTDLGALMAGGKLFTYTQGTTTHKTAYTNAAGTVAHTYSTDDGGVTQYIALNARGELPAPLYLTAGAYDITLKTSAGATVWTRRADPSGAAETAIYTPAGTGATTRTVQDKLREFPSTADISDGVSLAALNQAIANVSNGTLLIPPGDYSFSGDLLISAKAPGATAVPQGGFTLEAAGVRFSGTGKIIVDGSKRVTINGLDAPGFDLCLRGVWWSQFNSTRIKRVVLGDAAGLNFNSNYWNEFNQCQLQAIVNSTFSTFNNAFWWNSCSLRGNANQGFTGTADYGFEFNGNTNCQAWVFAGGDVSYHNTAIYNVDAGNTAGDIELTFDGTYFDTLYPTPINRVRSRLQTKNCHFANDGPHFATLPAVARGGQDAFRQDRSMAWAQFSGVNFIPNGDFRMGLSSYAGAGLPLGAIGGATITEVNTSGSFSRYLNINQPSLGISGIVRFRPRALPFNGRYTGALLIRNADVGTRTMRLGFNSLFEVIDISDPEWTFYTLTGGADIAAGATPDIIIRSDDDVTAYNVDV